MRVSPRFCHNTSNRITRVGLPQTGVYSVVLVIVLNLRAYQFYILSLTN